jgi:transposase
MSRPRKSMKHIRTICQTRLLMPEASIRYIAHVSRCSRPAARQYLELFKSHPITAAELESLNDQQLAQHLGIEARSIQETSENQRLGQWLDTNQQRLHEKHMTRRLLHEYYQAEAPNGLSYSQFCLVLQRRMREPEACGMFDHKAGDKLYIDFTGKKFDWQEENGPAHTEEVYLAVLGASSCFFALPVPNQKKETFAAATSEAFGYFGGVPHAVVPDCLKSAVLSHDGYEPVLNPLFQRLLDHYGVVSIPARPHHPKDKPVAETTVKIVYTRMLARLNGQSFSSRTAMLKAWMAELHNVNAAPFQKLPGSRMSRFEQIDKPALRPLPGHPFSLTDVLTQTVKTTLAVYVPADETAYSVPGALQGKTVEIVVTPSEIKVWHGNECHATHQRCPGSGKVINTEHLPTAQHWYATRNPGELIRAFQSQGHHLGRWASHILDTAEHEDIAWRVLDGLRGLVRKHPKRIDVACRLALPREAFTLKALRAILASGEDLTVTEQEALTAELPFHENIRGAAYFETEARS